MQKTKKLLAAAITVILGMTLLCGIGTVKTNASEEGGLKELRIGSTDAKCIGHFDTTAAFDGNYNGYSMDLVYDYILFKNPDAEGYTSNILTDWYWDEELCAAVIKLRQDVYFSDGDQMTGDDIVYTFERMGSSFMSGAMKAVMDFKSIHVAEDDEFTVVFPFYYAYGPWRDYLAVNSAVHNRSWEEAHGGASMDFDDPANICGSGPYRVAEYVVDAYTVFEKRDDWWMEGQQPEGTAAFDRITIINYSDVTTMMVEYEMHEADNTFVPLCWHFSEERARLMGNARPFNFGGSAANQLLRLATNWMGDTGEVRALNWRHLTRTHHGDCTIGYGKVIRKYKRADEYCVDILAFLLNLCRGNLSEAAVITVALPVHSQEKELTGQFGEVPVCKTFSVGDKVRVAHLPEYCFPTGYPLEGSEGIVEYRFQWQAADFHPLEGYTSVRITKSDRPLTMGNVLILPTEILEKG